MKDNLVVQHNDLVTASYAMTRHEQTYYCPVLARLTAVSVWTKGKYLPSQLSKPETCFYNGNDQYNAYRDLKTASERLFERKIRLQLDNGKELLTRFVQSVIFDPEAGR